MRPVFPLIIASLMIGGLPLSQKAMADTAIKKIELNDKYKNADINIVKKSYHEAKDINAKFVILNNIEKYNSDNKDVLLFLGDVYSRIPGVLIDTPKAIDYYKKAAELGNLWGFIRLGDIYNDGTLVPRNAVQAVSYYKTAADGGLPFAKLRMGNSYISGNGVQVDIAAGLKLIMEAAESGDKWALMKLGYLYRLGDYVAVDGHKSVEFYQKAALADNNNALIKLAEIYRDGIIASKDARKSISYYEQATDKGLKQAAVFLGQNHIWKKFDYLSDPAKGKRLLTEAYKTGEPSAAAALAKMYMNGNFGARNPERAIRILTRAANDKNIAAITLLLSYYRDGKNGVFLKNIKKARDVFQKYQAIYTPAERAREEILLHAASAHSANDYTKIIDLLKDAPVSHQSEIIVSLANVNANAYVLVVQERLKQRGLYNGKLTGRLTTSTIQSIKALCNQSVAAARCEKGPLNPAAVRLIALLLS